MRPSRFTQLRRQHGRRLVVAVALLLSLALVSFSITRLLRAQRESKQINVTIQRLSREIEAMNRELDTTNAPMAFEALRLEEQSLLVSSNDLSGWTEQLAQQGVPLVFDVTPQVGTPFTGALAERGLKIFPVTVDLVPPKGIMAVNPPYQRLLQFLHGVSRQTPRVDLVELTVAAEAGGIERATAVYNVWVGEAGPTLAAGPTPEISPAKP